MHTSDRSTLRRRRARAFVAAVALALGVLVFAPTASSGAATAAVPAHNKTSLIEVTVSAAPGGVSVQAQVRYDDGDPVLDEDVVGLLRNSASGETTQLTLAADGRDGRYATVVTLGEGSWDVEIDAVTYTRGVRTVHFTLDDSGAVSGVHAGAALPSDLERPTTTRSRVAAVIVGVLVVALGVLALMVRTELRRR